MLVGARCPLTNIGSDPSNADKHVSQLTKTFVSCVDTCSLWPAQGARLALGARSIALGDTTAYFSGPTFRAATYSPSAKQVRRL